MRYAIVTQLVSLPEGQELTSEYVAAAPAWVAISYFDGPPSGRDVVALGVMAGDALARKVAAAGTP